MVTKTVLVLRIERPFFAQQRQQKVWVALGAYFLVFHLKSVHTKKKLIS